MENPVSISRVKLKKISVMNLSFLFSLFGLVNGLITGIIFFIVIKMSLTAFSMVSVPITGLVLLSFLGFPLVMAILFWIVGLISGLFFNLFLKATKGLGMYYEELD